MLQPELLEELKGKMSLTRLAKTGLFQKLDPNTNDDELRKELKLHRTVLDKALIDSFSINDRIRIPVEQWLKIDNEEFIDACDRAALNPGQVYQVFMAVKAILKGHKARFRKFGASKEWEM
jgi:hypothetical protein